MGFTNPPKNVALDAIGAQATYISLHTADPGTTGAAEVVTDRKQTTWSPASAATKAGSQVGIAIPAGTTITHWGLWTAATGGAFHYGGQLSAPESYGGAGMCMFTPQLSATG